MKILAVVVAAVGVLAGVVVVNTLSFRSVQEHPAPADPISIDVQQAAEHLAKALTFKTISFGVAAPISKDEFEAFHRFLEETYPRTHAALTREVVGGFSLLYSWPGSEPSLKPLLLMGHFDVVPVPPDTESVWKQPPFDGRIVDGEIWGRGAADDKLNVIGELEAVEWLLAQGFTPKRTVLLAFGHDEELGGPNGAAKIAALLKERGVELECVVDEGGSILEGMMPGVSAPTALIGIAEKGYMSLSLTVEHPGGHSSMPPPNSAIGVLARAITRLEDNPFPTQFAGPTREMFAALGPEMPFLQRAVFANLWLFEPIVARMLAASPQSNAMLRTTTAVTIINGGVKDNVLPTEARAVVNFRILPGENKDTVLERVRRLVNDDRVTIEPIEKDPRNPSPVSNANAASYRILAKTIRQVCPGVVVGPYLVLGGTDARHFTDLSENVYRFTPKRFRSEDMSMLHGPNERIKVDNFGEVVRFYVQLIRNFNG